MEILKTTVLRGGLVLMKKHYSVTSLLKLLKRKTIPKEQVLKIVNDHINKDKRGFEIYEHLPESCVVYGRPKEDCWYVFYDHWPGWCGVDGSRRLICVSKSTGNVVLDGIVYS